MRPGRVAGALREKRHQRDQQEAFAVARRLHEDGPALLGELLFQANGLLDLDKLFLDEIIIHVAVGVVLFPISKRACTHF